MRRHVHRAQLVDEVFCIVGFVGAKCDRCRSIGTRLDHVQRGHPFGMTVRQRQAGVDGLGALADVRSQAVTYFAPEEPGLARVRVTVRQRDLVCVNEALITVTNELLAQINAATAPARGLPSYTFERAPGESWRSKFDTRRNLIVVNNGHRDFVYASRAKSLKLRYLVRLYAKELVLHNFAGLPTEHLLERMVELSLRTEEHL
jgi:hypothetical protein